jgi:glycosyltransferase involved in cell wall biosynthesis
MRAGEQKIAVVIPAYKVAGKIPEVIKSIPDQSTTL